MKMKWCLTGFLLFIFCAGIQLHAQQSNNDSKLFEETKAEAEKGDAGAQFNLGVMYHKGDGVPRDDAEAAKWYRKAAEQGNAAAECYLGLAYAYGEGLPRNKAESSMWNRKAAEQGFALAQDVLRLPRINGQRNG
jgi:uncharacterized protein